MRATIDLDPSAFQAAKTKSIEEKISLDEAISRLILQAAQAAVDTPANSLNSNGVFRSAGGKYTSQDVEAALLDD